MTGEDSKDEERLRNWLGRLHNFGLVESSGRTKARIYYIASNKLREFAVPTTTSLDRIEPHRLEALLLEDLKRFPDSRMEDVRDRIGAEIHYKKVKRALDELVSSGQVTVNGSGRWRSYRLKV